MRLVIEDDTGAAWEVAVDLDLLDLHESEEDRENLAFRVCETIDLIKETRYDPFSEDMEEDDPVDDINPADDSILDTELMDLDFDTPDRNMEAEDE